MDLLILAATCAINLIWGVLVLLRDSQKTYTRLFVLVCVLLTLWIIANFITNHNIHDLFITNIANRLTYVGGFAVLLVGLLFTYHFPFKRKVTPFEKVTLILVSTIVLILSATEWVAGDVTLNASDELQYSVGSLLTVFIVGFLFLLVLMARNLLSHPKSSGRKKRQALLVLLAFSATAVVGLLLNVVIPLLVGDWTSTRFGPLVTIILVATISYTIIKHGLFDMRLAVVRAVTYILSLTTLAGIYYGIAYTFSRTIDTAYISLTPLNIALALLLTFIFQPVKYFFDKVTNKIFYRDSYDVDEFFARLSKELSATTDMNDLLERAAREIGATLKAEYVTFFIRYGEDKHVEVSNNSGVHISDVFLEKLDALRPMGRSLIIDETLDENSQLYRLLKKHEIAFVLPLESPTGLVGYLLLGYQRAHDYTKRDVRAIETISDELVIAIQNALSVQEIKEINSTLQERIEEATKELRASNLQLQRLDEAKDEFVSMASHQLRTPLTSVKGYISMVLEGDMGKITTTQRQVLGEAYTSSERMVHLINDFLNVSRLQTGKFMLEKHPIDLSKIVAKEVESLQTTAKARELTLEYHKPSYFPTLYLDEGKIRQVLMNFIDNAIYYSHEDMKIEVKLEVVGGEVVLTVRDEGIGVPKEEQVHLFSKFFRASNARKQRPDGTGVGLFLAKKVVVAHGGKIIFESTEGKGSTFGFRLPIKKLSVRPKNDSDKLN
jgi:signal transduction histidine kinase